MAGIVALLTLICSPLGYALGAMTVLVAGNHYVQNHDRGDHSSLVKTLIYGGVATGLTFSAPTVVPLLAGAVQAIWAAI